MKHMFPVALSIRCVLGFSVALLPAVALAQDGAVTGDPKSALLALFIQYVAPVLFTGLASLLGWAFLQLGRKFGADAQGSKRAQVLDRVFVFAQAVVADLEATLKPELLKATADGVLTPAERLHLRDVALARLKALAGERGLTEVQAVLGIVAPQLDAFLLGIIERAVDALPKGSPAPASP